MNEGIIAAYMLLFLMFILGFCTGILYTIVRFKIKHRQDMKKHKDILDDINKSISRIRKGGKPIEVKL